MLHFLGTGGKVFEMIGKVPNFFCSVEGLMLETSAQ